MSGTFSLQLGGLGTISISPGIGSWTLQNSTTALQALLTCDIGGPAPNAKEIRSPLNTPINIRMQLDDSKIILDGGTPIDITGLPAGFTITGVTLHAVLDDGYTTDSFRIIGDGFGSIQSAILNSGDGILDSSGSYNVRRFSYDYIASQLEGLTMDALCGIGNGVGVKSVAPAPGYVYNFDQFYVTGTYKIQSSSSNIPQPVIQNSTTSITPGDKIEITSATGGLDGVTKVDITFTDPVKGPRKITIDKTNPQDPQLIVDGVIYYWLDFIISFDPTLFLFYLPFGFGTYSGPITITLTIEGTEFSGSIRAGVLQILFSDASGIYQLVRGQTNDILYFRVRSLTNFKFLFLSFEENISDFAVKAEETDDFFASMDYPTAILAQTEDYDYDDFTIIGTPGEFVLKSVEIPSPYVHTAFLP